MPYIQFGIMLMLAGVLTTIAAMVGSLKRDASESFGR